ncbi:MAG: hypothetical protein A2V90_01830 [Gammaproteobacteria bacterium RBG_16_57_12]|nr:MAG: hypothetical protein A2V90_01830 [Gammaproteobacteria bacterium RBG_16_57_12]
MVIQEFLMKNPGVLKKSVEIIATDISSAIIKEAESGVYDGIALVRGLSEERKQRFFRPLPGNAKWEVKKEIRERVKFRTFNLMENYASLGRFDIVFCRNVLIYFSHNLKKDILARIARSLQPGGYLLLGGSETISGYSSEFEMVRGKVGTLYRLI